MKTSQRLLQNLPANFDVEKAVYISSGLHAIAEALENKPPAKDEDISDLIDICCMLYNAGHWALPKKSTWGDCAQAHVWGKLQKQIIKITGKSPREMYEGG